MTGLNGVCLKEYQGCTLEGLKVFLLKKSHVQRATNQQHHPDVSFSKIKNKSLLLPQIANINLNKFNIYISI